MKKFKKGRLIIALFAIVIAGAGIYAATGQKVEVSAVAAGYGAIEKLITETGSVASRSSVTVSSKIQGQLLSVDVTEGDKVTEGQRLASYTVGSGAADIGSLRAQISGLSAQAAQAGDYAEKSKKLYEEGAMSFEEYSRADAEVKQIAAQIASLNYTISGLSEAAGAAGVAAPISGTVTAVLVSEGEITAPGAIMFEISDLTDTYISVNLISEDADKIAEGAAVRVFSESELLMDDSAAVSKIFVSAQDVVSDLGIVQKRVPVEITTSGGQNLRLGSNVNVEIIADRRDSALRAPGNAIFEQDRQQHVYVIEDGKARLRPVETGLAGERYTEITGGLSEGDLVITSPGREISDGTKIKEIK